MKELNLKKIDYKQWGRNCKESNFTKNRAAALLNHWSSVTKEQRILFYRGFNDGS